MTIIKIETVELRINSGDTAYITGIDVTSTDSLEGYVHFLSGDQVRVSWSILGNARDKNESFNLSEKSMDTAEFDDLKAATIHLVLPGIRQQIGFV